MVYEVQSVVCAFLHLIKRGFDRLALSNDFQASGNFIATMRCVSDRLRTFDMGRAK